MKDLSWQRKQGKKHNWDKGSVYFKSLNFEKYFIYHISKFLPAFTPNSILFRGTIRLCVLW